MSKFNYNISQLSSFILFNNTAWSNYGPADGICAARGTILHKSCRLEAAATFFFEERYDFGTKIGTS